MNMFWVHIVVILFRPFGFIALKALYCLDFQFIDFERTWWKLFQKRVVSTKFEIYVFIIDGSYFTHMWKPLARPHDFTGSLG
jgi:hypothetical protein